MPAARTEISRFRLPLQAARAAAAAIQKVVDRAGHRLAARGLAIGSVVVECADLGVVQIDGAVGRAGEVVVAGDLPAMPGVELLGEVHRLTTDDGAAVPIVRGFGGEIPAALCALDAHGGLPCDHCQVSRRRGVVYVVRSADGSVRRLGGDCLEATRLGLLPALADALAAIHGAIAAAREDDEGGGGFGRASGVPARTWILEVCRVVARYGWTSGRRAHESGGELSSSAQLAREAIEDRRSGRRVTSPTREDRAEAGDVLAWLAGLEAPADDTYMSSLAALGRVSHWPDELLGLAASAVVAYHRALVEDLPAPGAFLPRARSVKPASRRKNAPMVEVEGTFVVARAVCVRAIETQGTYGPRIGYVFYAVEEQAELVWWTATVPRDLVPLAADDPGDRRVDDLTEIEGVRYRRVPTFRPGRVVALEGRIKGSKDYKGRPSTTVTHLVVRPAAEDEAPVEAAPAVRPTGRAVAAEPAAALA